MNFMHIENLKLCFKNIDVYRNILDFIFQLLLDSIVSANWIVGKGDTQSSLIVLFGFAWIIDLRT